MPINRSRPTPSPPGPEVLVSTVDAYVELAAISNEAAREQAWTEQYEAAWPDVFDTYYSGWGEVSRRSDAVRAVPELVRSIREREQRAERLVGTASARLRQVGLLDDGDIETVLLVGVHSSNTQAGSRSAPDPPAPLPSSPSRARTETRSQRPAPGRGGVPVGPCCDSAAGLGDRHRLPTPFPPTRVSNPPTNGRRLRTQERRGDDGDAIVAAIRLGAGGDEHGVEQLVADSVA